MRGLPGRRGVLAAACAIASLGACAEIAGVHDVPGLADGSAGDGGADSPFEAGSCGDADLASDPRNCGACGRDCLGGACEAGTCAAFLFAPGTAGMSGIVTDESSVYWGAADAGGVMVCPQSSDAGWACPAAAHLVQDLPACGARCDVAVLALLGSNVIWTSHGNGNGGVHACGHEGAGCVVPTELVAPDAGVTQPMTSNSSAAYWVRVPANEIDACLGDACDGGTAVVPGQTASALAADENNLFDVECDPNTSCSSQLVGRYKAKNLAKLAPVVFGVDPSPLAADANDVYFVQNGVIASCPATSSCTKPTPVGSTGGNQVFAMISDGQSLYWGTTNAQAQAHLEIVAAPLDGGAQRTLWTRDCACAEPLQAIATGARAVYWIASDGIWAIAK